MCAGGETVFRRRLVLEISLMHAPDFVKSTRMSFLFYLFVLLLKQGKQMRQGIPGNEHNVIFVKNQRGDAYLFLRKTEGLTGDE
ncbi:hypothetical protein [Enterobacter cloacae]|uniref:hypothetical protein n=1 Tax=Enterobacter cloacae TaxID=550 RepID=UPI0021D1F615|nr:hypothetical protein [Enterobacter cloacae]MCU6209263.1 hypothetical protein [Enterobacter cloacae]